jgi:hypothetical protein
MFFTLILIAAVALLAGDAIYARAKTGLRRRATAAQQQRPARDLTSPSDRGWHTPLSQERR